jgi:hypothetical protein
MRTGRISFVGSPNKWKQQERKLSGGPFYRTIFTFSCAQGDAHWPA